MKRYEAKIRSDVQKVLDSLGFSHLHVASSTRGATMMLAKKCGQPVCYIPTVQFGADTVREDVAPIVELITDWLNETYPTIRDFIKAEEYLAAFDDNVPKPDKLPKGVDVRSGGYGIQIIYENYKIKGRFFWDMNKKGEITKFDYEAPTRIKDRPPYKTWIRHLPEQAHIDAAAKIRTYWAKHHAAMDKVRKLREQLNSCTL